MNQSIPTYNVSHLTMVCQWKYEPNQITPSHFTMVLPMGIWTKSNHTKSLYYGYASGNMNQSMPTYNVSYLTMVLPVELWTKNKSHQVTFLWLCQWNMNQSMLTYNVSYLTMVLPVHFTVVMPVIITKCFLCVHKLSYPAPRHQHQLGSVWPLITRNIVFLTGDFNILNSYIF